MNEKDIIKAEYTFEYFKEETLLLREENKQLQKKIDKAIKYIEEKYEMILKDSIEDFLDHDELIEKKQIKYILNILKGEKKNG